MSPLPPHLERLHDELMAAARARAEEPAVRRRPRGRMAAVVAVAVLGTAGVALAATSTNPIDWLRGGDPQRELRVAPDEGSRVDGDFPQAIECPPAAETGPATCHRVAGERCTEGTLPDGSLQRSCVSAPTPAGAQTVPPPDADRRYELMNRVFEPPHLDAQLLRTAFAGRDPDDQLFPMGTGPYRATVAQVLAAADDAPEEFWRSLEVLVSMQGGSTSSGDPDNPRNELVPPAGVARFITCIDDAGLRCRPLTNGERLPVGAPLYSLQPDAGWRSVPRRAQTGADFLDLQRQVFGRDLTPREQLLVLGLLAPVTTVTSGPDTVTAPAEAVTPAP